MVNNSRLSGLSDEELRYEKIVDEIKNEPSTLKCIGILNREFAILELKELENDIKRNTKKLTKLKKLFI